MTVRGELEEALWQEFASYYLPEELEPGWQQYLPQMARASALRPAHDLDGQRVRRLWLLLMTAQQDQGHPVVALICDATLIDWTECDQDWQVLRLLLQTLHAEVGARGVYVGALFVAALIAGSAAHAAASRWNPDGEFPVAPDDLAEVCGGCTPTGRPSRSRIHSTREGATHGRHHPRRATGTAGARAADGAEREVRRAATR